MTIHLPKFLPLLLIACAEPVKITMDTRTIKKEIVDNDGDGINEDFDCDDNDAKLNPSAEEVCDGVDNNCDDSNGLIFPESDEFCDGEIDEEESPKLCQVTKIPLNASI